jgi:hypothetical protein
MKHKLINIFSSAALILASTQVWAAGSVSMKVPGATDEAGRKVLTFVAKDPPGVRCNGNVQVAAEITNTYRVPIQLIPSSLAPDLPAPSVFYGNELLAADGKDHNGAVSFQMVSDVLEVEGVAKQAKEGLLFNSNVRRNFDDLKDSIKSGGK